MESSGNQTATQGIFEKKKKTIYDVMESLAHESQIKVIFVAQLVSILIAVLTFYYVGTIPEIKESSYYNSYMIATIISIAISFLCVFSIGLFIYQCSKRIYPKSSITILIISLILNLIFSSILNIIKKENLIITVISFIIELAIYIIIFSELNTLISLYNKESIAMTSDTLKIICIALGVIVSLGALLSLRSAFSDVLNTMSFLVIVASAVIYFSLSSLINKYNDITARYMYNNELVHKETKTIKIPQDHWRCPRCNTKNSINDKFCANCRTPLNQS